MPTPGGTAFTTDYTRLIELLNTDGTTLVSKLCDTSDGTDFVTKCEFEWLRQGGCGGGTLHIDRGFEEATIEVGQYIRCSYKDGTPWYLGRIEEVSNASPSGVDVRMFGMFVKLTETTVGGQPWWDTTAPQTFGKYDYFTSDPDYAFQDFTTIATMQALLDTLYTSYIAPLGIGLDTIDAPDVDGSFSSITFRGGESVSQVLNTLADASGASSFGVNAAGNFFFVPLNTTVQAEFTKGPHGTVSRTADRSVLYNRLVLHGGYVYGTGSEPGFFLWESHHEDSTSVTANGPKTMTVVLPWVRDWLFAQNFADGFFQRYAGATQKFTFDTIPQGGVLYPWGGTVTLTVTAVGAAADYYQVTDNFDTCKVTFDHAPKFSIITGPEVPKYPQPETSAAGEQSAGGGGGGDAKKVSGWSGVIGSYSIDSCNWPPCEQKQVGFVVTSAFPLSGYCIGDVYYSTKPVCPRAGITFFDMETPIGEYVSLGDPALADSDYNGRVGTATYMRRYADHDIDGCKWYITGLFCPPTT